jgi:hypothetical protein
VEEKPALGPEAAPRAENLKRELAVGDFAQRLDGLMPPAAPVDDQARFPIQSSIAGAAAVGSALSSVLDRGQRTIAAASQAPRRSRATLWIACIGALAYNSWPLAFIVDPPLAGSALASSFEGRNEPFAWLFILLDCIAGLCTAVVCVRELRPHRGRARVGGAVVFALLGYAVFGISTAVDAVVPLQCGSSSAQACASQIWPLTPDDLLTGAAIFALFIAAVSILVRMARTPVAFPPYVPAAILLTLTGWSALGLVVLMWSSSATMAAVSQYAFLTLTSVLSFVVPLCATLPRPGAENAAPAAQSALSYQRT